MLKYYWKNVKNTIKTIEKMSKLCYPIYMLMFINENEMLQMPKVEIKGF